MQNRDQKIYWVVASLFVIIVLLFLLAINNSSSNKKVEGSIPQASEPTYGGSRSREDIESIQRYTTTPEYQTRLAEVERKMDGRILFFGKVIDHEGKPVSGARVNYITLAAGQLAAMGHDSLEEVATDEMGGFKIEKKNGMTLSIENIKKDGYRFVTGGKVFTYGFGSNSSPHKPDLQRPVEFLLIPDEFKFADVARPLSVGIELKWNVGPMEVPIGKTGEVLILNPRRDMKDGEREGFSWKVGVEIRNGEILMRDKKDILPLAPLQGYQKEVVIGYERGELNWGSAIMQRQFVFRTKDGNYGKFDLNIYADREESVIAARLLFRFNPIRVRLRPG